MVITNFHLFVLFEIYYIAKGRQGNGPFEIEIEKLPTEQLGANLVTFGNSFEGTKRLIISHIRDGSIADRFGQLNFLFLLPSKFVDAEHYKLVI